MLSGWLPAQSHVDWLRMMASQRKLGDLVKKVRKLEKLVETLEKKDDK